MFGVLTPLERRVHHDPVVSPVRGVGGEVRLGDGADAQRAERLGVVGAQLDHVDVRADDRGQTDGERAVAGRRLEHGVVGLHVGELGHLIDDRRRRGEVAAVARL